MTVPTETRRASVVFPFAGAPIWRSTSFLIAVALVLLRTGYAAFPNLFPEEAYYWSYAKHFDYGYLDHPPMVAWLIALGTSLFGDTEFGVRLCALVCSLVTATFVFRLTALLYDQRAAAVAFLAVQVLPFFFLAGFVTTPDAPLTACWAGMLYYLAEIIFFDSVWSWLGVGVCLGLGMLAKYTIALLGPTTLLFLALDPPSRRWFRHGAPYLAVALSVVIFSPVIWWNAAHHWASFAFQTTGRTRVRRHFALHELVGAILCVLTPVGAWLAGRALVNPPACGHQIAETPGFIEPRRRQLFARVFTLVPLSVFVLFSLTHLVKLNWTGPLWLAAIPALAASLSSATSPNADRLHLWRHRAWLATVVVCGLIYALGLQYLSFGLPEVRYASKIELLPVGWFELARDLEAQKLTLEKTTGGTVYTVGMDRNFIASEVAFYQSDQVKSVRETTGVHLFLGTSLMYAYWFPPDQLNGANFLLVGFRREELDTHRVSDYVRTADPIEAHQLTRHGKPIRTYYTRAVYGYRSAEAAALR